jgi:ABC-type transport system involved in multi-copper enzyme maturation permease subunit
LRLGPGPVFAFEWLAAARRWQGYALRSLFVAGLLTGLWVVWLSEVSGRSQMSIRAQAEAGASFFYALVGMQLSLVLLAAPAATAGAICVDRARGALAHVLVTDLSDAEIVLGKLAARLVPVAGLVGCGLPVLALGTLLGGIDPVALTGAFVVTLGAAALACALALCLSIWGKKTHEVLVVAYVLLLVWALGGPALWAWRAASGSGWTLPEWFTSSNPFWLAFAPYAAPGTVGIADYALFTLGTLSTAAALAALSVARIRPVSLRLFGASPKKPRQRLPRAGLRWPRLWRGPSLDANPVLWREWHRDRPSRWLRAVWMLFACASLAVAIVEVGNCVAGSKSGQAFGALVVGGLTSLGLLLLAITAPSSLAEERVRGSLDLLMATPMPTRQIVMGKWRATFRMVPRLAIMPGIVMLVTGLATGRPDAALVEVALILAYGAALTSLGLGLATWIARQGRAMAWAAASYCIVTIGWFFLVVLLTEGAPGVFAPGLASGSPFIGTIFVGIQMHEPNPSHWTECLNWLWFWAIAYAVLALVLLLATLRSFDRCLGRVACAPRHDRDALRTSNLRVRALGCSQSMSST